MKSIVLLVILTAISGEAHDYTIIMMSAWVYIINDKQPLWHMHCVNDPMSMGLVHERRNSSA